MKRTSIAPLFILLLLSAWTNLGVQKPEGFAEVKTRDQYQAVSPEGMLYRVRIMDNYPIQDLDFWSKALKNHLIKEGYNVTVDGERFETAAFPGVLFEWAVPYGHENYLYLTAIVVTDKQIAIAEAAAEHSVYRLYREVLKQSLESIIINPGYVQHQIDDTMHPIGAFDNPNKYFVQGGVIFDIGKRLQHTDIAFQDS